MFEEDVEDVIVALVRKDWGNNKIPQSGWLVFQPKCKMGTS
jgi:hypothetical protein